ncbi:MAG: lytic transglycosylase domain-containing protein, partial [Bdellovibrio sp.]
FAFLSWKKPTRLTVESVHEASRIAHAKELLGSEYLGSDAQGFEGKASLSSMIHRNVLSSLAPKWKGHASAITRTVIRESEKYKLDPVFVLAVIKTESKFNPEALGRFGEIGLMQIKPNTAEWIAKKFNLPWKDKNTLKDPCANIRISLAYMNFLRTTFNKKALKYVSAYNMGPANVRRLLSKNVKPAEYTSRIMKNYTEIYALMSEKKEAVAVATRI